MNDGDTVSIHTFIDFLLLLRVQNFSTYTVAKTNKGKKGRMLTQTREREQETARLKLRIFHCLFSQGEQKKIEESKAVSV